MLLGRLSLVACPTLIGKHAPSDSAVGFTPLFRNAGEKQTFLLGLTRALSMSSAAAHKPR